MLQQKKVFVSPEVGEIWSLVAVHENRAEGEKLPLLVFLHGMGERGHDLDLLCYHGVGRFLKEGREFPAVVFCPQCPVETKWRLITPFVKEMILAVAKEYNVDESRISVTGISMGGYGTWDLMGKYPELWYKVAPICGGGDAALAPNMKDIPTRVYHGQKDEAVPFAESEKMVEAIKAAGGAPEFFVYPEIGHNVWDTAYRETDLMDWLLA
ncbi:MAG: phospholipase [Clostridiales bacterium]|nr:phospholipase [Clostridiales bacterium]